MALIHLLDDDEAFVLRMRSALETQRHEVHCFSTPHAFFYQLNKKQPRCAIIDWMLPEMQGVDVVRRLRQVMGDNVGVIMLSAIDDEQHFVNALGSGADDYIVKPSTTAVVGARIDALMRRLGHEGATSCQRIEVGPYALDFSRQTVCVEGQAVELTPREFDLAWTLFSSPARLFTKQELLSSIWGKNSRFGFHTIAQHVYSVRKKLALADHGFRLFAVYASGYRLQLPDGLPRVSAPLYAPPPLASRRQDTAPLASR